MAPRRGDLAIVPPATRGLPARRLKMMPSISVIKNKMSAPTCSSMLSSKTRFRIDLRRCSVSNVL